MTTPQFPIIEATLISSPPPPFKPFPFFIIGYWHGYWQIHKDVYPDADCEQIIQELHRLQDNGWAHLQICKLPQ